MIHSQDLPIFDGFYLYRSGDAMLLAIVTPPLNAVGVPVNIRVVLLDSGDW
jgi:hypothetical protein